MGKINAEWHKKNRMPDYLQKYKQSAVVNGRTIKGMKTEEIKAMWHELHSKNCNCR